MINSENPLVPGHVLGRTAPRLSPADVIYHVARVMLGGAYVGGGLIPFIHWGVLPYTRPVLGNLMNAFVTSDLLVISKSLEIIFGLLLIANRWVPLAIVMTAPVLFIIAWVDWYLDPFPGGVVAVFALVTCQTIVALRCQAHFLPLFARKVVK